jgi:hypothetical protein
LPTHPSPSAKNEPGEYAVFEDALKKIVSVPRSAIKLNPKSSKRKRTKRASRASADRA